MAGNYVVVLDGGTSSCRSFVYDEQGQIIGSAVGDWTYAVEEDAPSFARALDPDAIWNTICHLIATSLGDADARADDIRAVGITTQRQAVAFLDSQGRELFLGPNLDLRAVFEGAAIDEELADTVYTTTGHLPSFFFTLAKLRWFQTQRPDAFCKIATVLTLADWLGYRLTGVAQVEASLAGEAGLLSIRDRQWCSNLFDALDLSISPSKLAKSGTITGSISERSALETGLLPDTPVTVAGADTQCGLLGMGIVEPGQVGIVAGWSAPVQMITERPVLSPERSTWAGCFLTGQRWVLESTPGDVGNAYNWLSTTMFEDAPGRFETMNELAADVEVGSEGAMAMLGPSRMDMSRLGMRIGGLVFPVPLTFSEFGRGHLVRATLEASAYAIRSNLEQVEQLAGVDASLVAVGGGMTRTPTFVRILADVVGREISVSSAPQVSAHGAYLCARTSLGEFNSLDEAGASIRSQMTTIKPRPLESAEYQDHYERWQELAAGLENLGL